MQGNNWTNEYKERRLKRLIDTWCLKMNESRTYSTNSDVWGTIRSGEAAMPQQTNKGGEMNEINKIIIIIIKKYQLKSTSEIYPTQYRLDRKICHDEMCRLLSCFFFFFNFQFCPVKFPFFVNSNYLSECKVFKSGWGEKQRGWKRII